MYLVELKLRGIIEKQRFVIRALERATVVRELYFRKSFLYKPDSGTIEEFYCENVKKFEKHSHGFLEINDFEKNIKKSTIYKKLMIKKKQFVNKFLELFSCRINTLDICNAVDFLQEFCLRRVYCYISSQK